MSTVAAVAQAIDPDEVARQDRIAHMPSLEQCYNMMDFEAVASRVMKKTAWAYYSSGADDEIVCFNSPLKIIANVPDNAREPFRLPQDLV